MTARRNPLWIVLPLTASLTAACAPWPDHDLPGDEAARAAPWPQLAPVSALIAQTPETRRVAGPPAARVTELRTRADALRGPVVPAATRAHMQAGVDLSAFP